MVPDTPLVRKVLAAASAALLVIGIVGAAVIKPEHDKSNRVTTTSPAGHSESPRGSTPTSATVPAGSPATGASPTTTAKPAATPTTAAPIKTESNPKAQPGPVTPPKAGTYNYKTNNDQTTPAKVENDGGANGVVRQVLTISSQQGSIRTELAWGPHDVTWISTALTSGQGSYSCNWQPPLEQFAVPMSTVPKLSVVGVTVRVGIRVSFATKASDVPFRVV